MYSSLNESKNVKTNIFIICVIEYAKKESKKSELSKL